MIIITVPQIIGLFLLALISLIALVCWCKAMIKEYFCKHNDWWENQQCQAICSNCGKDLGFVGTIRKRDMEAKKK